MLENINSLQPYLSVFPDPSTVFSDPVEKYTRHLHPLLSIDLSVINPAWDGKIHLICPVEPCEGFVGEYTTAYHNDFLKSNWIAFRLGKNSRYELMGDFRYFLLENPDIADPHPGHLEALKRHYADSHREFVGARDRFLEQSRLGGNLVDQLGGDIPFMNWTVYCYPNQIRLNVANERDPEARRNVYPLSPNGKRFHFIAGVPAYNYVSKCGADWIVLYYEPEERIAWLTFDYT